MNRRNLFVIVIIVITMMTFKANLPISGSSNTFAQAKVTPVVMTHSLATSPPPLPPPSNTQATPTGAFPHILDGNNEDGRRRISPTTSQPWAALVSLDITFDGRVKSCTGFFIGPRIVATAGRCLYDHNLGGWATSVRVVPGRDSSDEPFDSQYATYGHVFSKWVQEKDLQLDIGAVELPDESLALSIGGTWFRYGAFTDQSLIVWLAQSLPGNLAGYPLEEPTPFFKCPQEEAGFKGCQLWFQSDKIRSATYSESQICDSWPDCETEQKGLVGYQMDATAGQEGAPVWLYDGVERIAVGIHTLSANDPTCVDGVGGYNCGPLITPMVARFFEDKGAEPYYVPLGPLQAETPEPPAIMLIHGWRGDCATTFADLPDEIGQAMADKQLVSNANAAQRRVKCFDYNWRAGIVANASLLQTAIMEFKADLSLPPNHKIILVAHSFGGLVARYYTEQLNGDDHLSKLIMLGTPNEGVGLLSLAEPLCRLSIVPIAEELCSNSGFFLVDKALADMIPRRVNRLLNEGFVQPSSTYRVVIGAGGNTAGPLINWLLGDPNDCIVNYESAMGPGFPTVILDAVIHADLAPTGCGNNPHYFDDGAAKSIVLDAVFEGNGPFNNTNALPANIASENGIHNPFGTASNTIFDHVTPGKTNKYTVSVEAGLTRSGFALFWLGTDTLAPALQLTLEDPEGVIITETAAGITHHVSSGPGFGYLMFDTFLVDNPLTGTWTLQVKGSDVPGAGYNFVVMVLPDSHTILSTGFNQTMFREGDDILLTATLAENGVPLADTAVMATVTLPNDNEAMLSLNDSGVNGDAISGDGIYSTKFSAGTCGLYLFEITGTGLSSFGPITRQQFATITVSTMGQSTGNPCADGIYLPLVMSTEY